MASGFTSCLPIIRNIWRTIARWIWIVQCLCKLGAFRIRCIWYAFTDICEAKLINTNQALMHLMVISMGEVHMHLVAEFGLLHLVFCPWHPTFLPSEPDEQCLVWPWAESGWWSWSGTGEVWETGWSQRGPTVERSLTRPCGGKGVMAWPQPGSVGRERGHCLALIKKWEKEVWSSPAGEGDAHRIW